MIKLHKTLLAIGFISIGSMVLALTPQDVIADLQAKGYTRIEVKVGPGQFKVEAIRGTEKLEVIYDSASGSVLKTEVEAVGPGENTRPGVSIRERNKNFVRSTATLAPGATQVVASSSNDDEEDDDDENDDDDSSHGRNGQSSSGSSSSSVNSSGNTHSSGSSSGGHSSNGHSSGGNSGSGKGKNGHP